RWASCWCAVKATRWCSTWAPSVRRWRPCRSRTAAWPSSPSTRSCWASRSCAPTGTACAGWWCATASTSTCSRRRNKGTAGGRGYNRGMNTAASQPATPTQPDTATPLRFVTAASLFDGHDAAINIMRRLIQAQGAEVIHLGHNRSVEDVVRAALQEDADGIALSSYQGGHVEYLKYMVDMLRERGAGHIKVFAGGGGTITPEEI